MRRGERNKMEKDEFRVQPNNENKINPPPFLLIFSPSLSFPFLSSPTISSPLLPFHSTKHRQSSPDKEK